MRGRRIALDPSERVAKLPALVKLDVYGIVGPFLMYFIGIASVPGMAIVPGTAIVPRLASVPAIASRVPGRAYVSSGAQRSKRLTFLQYMQYI